MLLLSTGSTPLVRQTAAKQLGHIASVRIARASQSTSSLKHAQSSLASNGTSNAYRGLDGEWQEIVNLLVKVLPYLRSKKWETRVAAALAVESIVRAVGLWEPPDTPQCTQDSILNEYIGHSILADFNISTLLMERTILLAASHEEYVKAEQNSRGGHVTKSELVQSLGLAVPGAGNAAIGIDVQKELQDGEAQQSNGMPVTAEVSSKGKGKELVSEPAMTSMYNGDNPIPQTMSARERNALKRKRKAAGPSTDTTSASPAPPTLPNKIRKISNNSQSASKSQLSFPTKSKTPEPAERHLVKKEEDSGNEESGMLQTVTVAYKGTKAGQVEAKVDAEEANDHNMPIWMPPPDHWPFRLIVVSLQSDLMNQAWEIRHGAALGLREIIKIQGAAGGMASGSSLTSNLLAHQEWCEDLAQSLLRVFVLDRFSDFVGDQVVAPVRETSSQTLSALLLYMPDMSVYRVQNILLQMVFQENMENSLPESRKKRYFWEIRHAGLLGLKYLVAVRRDIFDSPATSKLVTDVKTPDTSLESSDQAGKALNLLKSTLSAALVG